MTREDAIIRLVGDLKKHHERAAAKHEMQVNLLCGYRDQLEDEVLIAAEMIAHRDGTSRAAASDLITAQYERRQAARKVAVTT